MILDPSHLLAGYLGGVTFAVFMAVFIRRSGSPVHWRFVVTLAMLWPIALPLFVMFPGPRRWRFPA